MTRVFLLLLLLSLAGPADAQEKIWRLGFLTPGADHTAPGSIRGTTLPFLAERGFVEGRNLLFVPAPGEGDLARLPQLAERLIQQRVDVIITVGALATRAALKAAPGTPIVLSFAGEDPVKDGFARSLARPGGAVTGIFFRGLESDAKRLELLSQALPAARVFGFVAAPSLEPAREELLARTAAKLRVSIITRMVYGSGDYAAAFDAFHAAGAAGVLIMGTTILAGDAPLFSPLAAERGIATICEWDYMAREGCVLGFGPDLVALRRLTGEYVARIFKGENPGDLPIQQPDRFILAVNLRAAAQLSLPLSPTFLARADEVIE
ncbi:putative ABC transport system substrate-binding protein [Rhizobiales bacterium GAS191]|nr:putative ABC transport system substrate-binding protein [Rhizobiales bacterium GAS191]